MILLSPDHRYARPYLPFECFSKTKKWISFSECSWPSKGAETSSKSGHFNPNTSQPNVSSKIADKPILEAAIDSVCDSWWIVNRQKETAKMCRDRDMNPTIPGLFWTQRDTPALKPHREIHAENNKYVQYWRLRNRTTHILYQLTTE